MFTLNCKGRILELDEPIVMGIINVTPDSFYAGSRKQEESDVLRQAEKMLNDGAAILDVGGLSTRPGSNQHNVDEELKRSIPAIDLIHQNFPEAFISIDTYRSHVAKEAIAAGACMVNDISGGSLDDEMLSIVGSLKVPYICMHMKGSPENMQQVAEYKDVTKEVLSYFVEKLRLCKLNGIHDVLVDPGFGFAKTIEHNFDLLNKLQLLHMLDRPLLVGISRKATIYKTLKITAEEALNGTSVLNTIALSKGAHILRVHDVKEAKEAITLCQKLKG